MKKPILEVIRFDEADIVTASGMGFTAANFGNEEQNDGIFTFFGGTGSGSVKTEDSDNAIVSAFNSYFGGPWSSTQEIWVYGSGWGSQLQEMIGRDRGDEGNDFTDNQRYNGTYYYRDGRFHSN